MTDIAELRAKRDEAKAEYNRLQDSFSEESAWRSYCVLDRALLLSQLKEWRDTFFYGEGIPEAETFEALVAFNGILKEHEEQK
jgi:hypothetical protein